MRQPVLVSLVTHNDAPWLRRCLESVLVQTVAVRVKVFDNASSDGTPRIARDMDVEIHASPDNTGFSHAHNWNLTGEDFETVLLLNADVVLEEDFVEKLLAALHEVPGAGIAGGKLYRMDEAGRKMVRNGRPLFDSTGIYMTPSQRHFDRGRDVEDRGQYDRRQLVFGITGAALAFTRAFYDDIRQDGEFLDEDFFAYREDADLAWRAQLRGWKVVYEPRAEALHFRAVVPSRRRQLAHLINFHSVKNRFLMRRKNMDRFVCLKCFPFMWFRDLCILLYLPLVERESIAALFEARRLRGKLGIKRHKVQSGRKRTGPEIARWFSFHPRAIDL